MSLITVTHEELLKAVSSDRENCQIIYVRIVHRQAIVLGPVASPIPRIKNRYRYQCHDKIQAGTELNRTCSKRYMEHYQEEMQKRAYKFQLI